MVKQILKTVYFLDEVKEKAIEQNRYININDPYWADFVIEDWKNDLDVIGFEDAQIYYSGFCSQGDGACFDANINVDKIANYLQSKNLINEDGKNKFIDLQNDFYLTIKSSHNCRYCHENSRYTDLDCFYIEDEENKIFLHNIELMIEELRVSLCKQIYKNLEDEYYSLLTDEAVYEALQAQACYFEEDGRIASF